MKLTKKEKLGADWSFYSDAVKDLRGSRPGSVEFNWFVGLTEAQRKYEIQEVCDSINVQTEMEEVQHQEDLVYLQTFGDFTENQLVAWGCL